MNYLLLFIVCIPTILHDQSTPWSERLEEKVMSTVQDTYTLEAAELVEVTISEKDEKNTSSKMAHNLYKVMNKQESVGYIYVAQAPSMKDVFDYIVLFDSDLNVKNTKVLIYREQHGRQIGAKRWLSQFFGMSPSDRPVLGQEIDGISGATISVTSMTKAIHSLLESVDYLKTQEAI